MTACDALEVGFISSLARPGGNITGVTCLSGELAVKRLALLREVVPRDSRAGVVGRSSSGLDVARVESLAQSWGVTLQSLTCAIPSSSGAICGHGPRARRRAVRVARRFTWSHAKKLSALAANHRLPAIYGNERFRMQVG